MKSSGKNVWPDAIMQPIFYVIVVSQIQHSQIVSVDGKIAREQPFRWPTCFFGKYLVLKNRSRLDFMVRLLTEDIFSHFKNQLI